MRIKNIIKIEKEKTYDLSIEDNHNYFVGKSEILVHNSGKDISKVDRSGAYIARKLAVDLLKKYNAKEVIVKLAYAIGVEYPVMTTASIDGKIKKLDNKASIKYIKESINFDNIKFAETAKWGPFGNGFDWDK